MIDFSKLSNLEVAALYFAMIGFRYPKTLEPSEKFKKVVTKVREEVYKEYMDRIGEEEVVNAVL